MKKIILLVTMALLLVLVAFSQITSPESSYDDDESGELGGQTNRPGRFDVYNCDIPGLRQCPPRG